MTREQATISKTLLRGSRRVLCLQKAFTPAEYQMKRSFVTFLALLSLLGLPIEIATAGTVRRPPGSLLLGPTPIWTLGTTSDIFQPLSDAIPSSSLVLARVYLDVDEATGGTNLRIRPAVRYSADGVSWDPPQPINVAYVSGNGVQAGTTFIDLTSLGATPKAYLQFGVLAKNNGAGNYELGRVTLLVEPKAQ